MITRALCFLLWCVLRAFAAFRPRYVIMLDGSPYITRWYLTRRPAFPAETGPGECWYLQHIHRADADRRLHNHPWEWARSWILRGGYTEHRFTALHTLHPRGGTVRSIYNPGDMNTILEATFHRIMHVEPNTWTLFHAGPKHGHGWGFMP